MANAFKNHIARGHVQIGMWLTIGDPTVTEICAGAGFDWLLIDAEHAPFDPARIAEQLRAVAGRAEPIVRVPDKQPWMIKQVLDIGVRTILVPSVESRLEAAGLAGCVRFPPRGVRGVASALSRASGFGRDRDYLDRADDDICLLALIESRKGIANCREIAQTDGVDGVFFGAADLAADMGLLGRATDASVQKAVDAGLQIVASCKKAGGSFAGSEDEARRLMALGASFLSVHADVTILSRGTSSLVKRMAVLKGG
jgi:4-hydroxy-2-oxoheptanedioate aldolase